MIDIFTVYELDACVCVCVFSVCVIFTCLLMPRFVCVCMYTDNGEEACKEV